MVRRFFVAALLAVLAGCASYSSTVQFYQSANHEVPALDRPPGHAYSVRDPRLERDLVGHLGSPVEAGNRIETLVNGDQIFPAMLAAIREARHTINFETFVYWRGDIGTQMAEALAERARAGVRVRILLDYFGTHQMDERLLNLLADSGARIEKYHPLRWYALSGLDHRTHRKLLVIDGRIGFTGGVGIAPEWTGHAQDPDHWRDNHYRIEGPVVRQLQSAFLSNWVVQDGDHLTGDTYFPELATRGDLRSQMVHSTGSGGGRVMESLYLLAIAASETRLDIATAYFVPDKAASEALIAARRRGVTVRIIVPGPYADKSTVRAASRSLWGPLLEAGVELYEFGPTMYHAKLLVVDDYFTSVGSSNFDYRSFRLNDEANLNVFDERFAREQRRHFEDDLGRSRRVTLAEWQDRPWTERLVERVMSVLAHEL